jgi:hypothetical protein
MVQPGVMGVLRSDLIDNWGSTEVERAAPFPCDELMADPPLTLYRAVDVAAPAAVVFRWLCQLRVAPYSYDWIDNFGRRSPRRLTPGIDELAVGQVLMTIFQIAEFEPGRSITATSDSRVFGHMAVTYLVAPNGDDTSRLVVKLLCSRGRSVFGRLITGWLPLGDLIMMRKQLLNLKALAERNQ